MRIINGQIEWDDDELRSVKDLYHLDDRFKGALQRLRTQAALIDEEDYRLRVLDFVTRLDQNLGHVTSQFSGAAPILELGLIDMITARLESQSLDKMPKERFLSSARRVAQMLTDFYSRSLVRLSNGDIGTHIGRQFPTVLDALSDGRRQAMQLTDDLNSASLSLSVQRAEEVTDILEEAAGDQATSDLWHHFDTYADTEGQRADVRQLLGAATIAVGISSATYIIYRAGANLDWASELAKLLLSLPVFGLAAYLFREAGQHRHTERSARETAVRLKTFKLFSEDLPSDQRQSLRLDFGRQVFTQAPVQIPSDNSTQEATALLGALTAALGMASKGAK